MEELYVEGVATRDGPEPCVDDPRGRGEALDRGTCRPGYRAAKWESGVPTLYKRWKATLPVAYRESLVDPARSKNQGMYGTFMRENRESPCPPLRVISGRAAQETPRR